MAKFFKFTVLLKLPNQVCVGMYSSDGITMYRTLQYPMFHYRVALVKEGGDNALMLA